MDESEYYDIMSSVERYCGLNPVGQRTVVCLEALAALQEQMHLHRNEAIQLSSVISGKATNEPPRGQALALSCPQFSETTHATEHTQPQAQRRFRVDVSELRHDKGGRFSRQVSLLSRVQSTRPLNCHSYMEDAVCTTFLSMSSTRYSLDS